MNWTKFLIATVIGSVIYFLLGWLVYGILFADFLSISENFRESVQYPEEEFKIGLMFLSCLPWTGMLTYIFMKWANISTFTSGLKAGALLGALITLASFLGLSAEFRIWTMQIVLANVVAATICTGITAGVIGWYLGRK